MVDDRARKARRPAPAPVASTASPLRMGHLAGGLLILVGLSGLWHGAQAAATPAVPPVTALAPAEPGRSTISVRDAYLTPTGPTDALAYFTVSNRGSRPDVLLATSADEIAHEATFFPSGKVDLPRHPDDRTGCHCPTVARWRPRPARTARPAQAGPAGHPDVDVQPGRHHRRCGHRSLTVISDEPDRGSWARSQDLYSRWRTEESCRIADDEGRPLPLSSRS